MEMKENPSVFNRCCLLISLLLVASMPVVAQSTESLGGSFNNPAGAAITKTIMDRVARRRLEKKSGVKTAATISPNQREKDEYSRASLDGDHYESNQDHFRFVHCHFVICRATDLCTN